MGEVDVCVWCAYLLLRWAVISNWSMCASICQMMSLSNGGLASNEPCSGYSLKKLPRLPKGASVSKKAEQKRGHLCTHAHALGGESEERR
jgi:hypothetical protein